MAGKPQMILCFCGGESTYHEHNNFAPWACPDEPVSDPLNRPDLVNHPPHYTSSPAACAGCGRPIECIDIAQHWTFPLGSALKYLWRIGLKGGPELAIEDLRKAKQYIDFEIARREATGTSA